MASARIEIINRDNRLRPGMVGRARILRKTYSNALVVPSTALLRLQNGVSAMVAENGVARKRELTVGAVSEEGVLVLNGLRAGDKLIVSGAFQLTDGSRIAY
jgi:membrane fusion protein (multidrug efflux system)